MATLTDAIIWVADIYQLATTDLVLGGPLPAGISNQQAQELANRTAWLKDFLENLQEEVDNIHPIGEIQIITAPAYNSADYDLDPASLDYGKGLAGTPAEHWALCFGNINLGTADMRGAFAAGLDPARGDYATVGATGGAESVALTLGQMPAHNHGGANFMNANGAVTFASGSSGSNAGQWGGANRVTTQGSNQAHENRPPYYVLVYRQRISN